MLLYLGQEGYVDLSIDSTRLGMPFDYTITAESNVNNQIPDLVICGYSINNGTRVNFTDFTNATIIGNVTATTNLTAIRVFVKWNDDVTNSTNDVADTAIALANGVAKIDININFEQVVGE